MKSQEKLVSSSSSSEDDVDLNMAVDDDDQMCNCGFCLLNYYSEQSASKGDWIRCQCCKTWYHEVCVGATGRKQFICSR